MADHTMSFVENISAAVDALGLQNAPTAFVLARIPWESREDRDKFLAESAMAIQMGGVQR